MPADDNPTYRSDNPSPHYRELLEFYRHMHVNGEGSAGKTAEKTFSGISLIPHIVPIRELITQTGTSSMLDYGCGKAMLYRLRPLRIGTEHVFPSLQDYWGVKEIRLYDPGNPAHAEKPQGTFDGVLCTDVLEHCPAEDIPWILSELFGYAWRFVYATIACFPSRKNLPSGENAHCTVRPEEWWQEEIKKAAATSPQVGFKFILSHREKKGGEDSFTETIFQRHAS